MIPAVLLASLLVSDSFAKLTNDCSCPNGDQVELDANFSKVPEPKKLRGNIFSSADCEQSGIGKAMNVFKSTVNAIKTPEGLKNPDEMLDYFSCYRASDEQFCHFRKTLSSYIALASESSGLPFAVQACLYYQESKFNPNAESDIPTGEMITTVVKDKKGKKVKVTKEKIEHANGYIQFMPETITEIEPVINGSMQDWQDKIANAEDNIKKEDTVKSSTKSETVKKRCEENIRYYETMIITWEAKIEARKVWDTYWEGTSEKPPTQISKVDLKNPRDAFALAVTKQTYDLALMNHISYRYYKIDKNGKFNKKAKTNLDDMKDQFLQINGKMKAGESAILLAGAYNAGRAGLANKCGTATALSQCLDTYLKASKKGNFAKETWIHMSAIDRCSKKGSTESTIYDRDQGAFEKKKDCKGSECK